MNYQPYTDAEDLIQTIDRIVSSEKGSQVWFVESYKAGIKPQYDIYTQEDDELQEYLSVFAVQVNIGTRAYRDPAEGYTEDFATDEEFDNYVNDLIDKLEQFDPDNLLYQLGDNVFLDKVKPVRTTMIKDAKDGRITIVEKPHFFVYCEPINEGENDYED